MRSRARTQEVAQIQTQIAGNFHFVRVENFLSGIHTRNFARAFIVEDVETGTRVVFVSCDTAMMGQLVKVRHLSLLIKM